MVLAEDGVLLRDGLTALLTRFGHEVVAAVGDAPALLAAVAVHIPDVVVTDVRMPPGFQDEGLHAAVRLRSERPGLPVLVLSQYVQRAYAAELLDSGDGTGVGYLLKDRVTEVRVLLDALGSIAAGGTVLDPEVVSHLLGRNELVEQLDRLSERERGVLELMAQGLSNRAIAERLVIDVKTVETHIARILTKLDLHQTPDEHRRVLAVLAWLRG